MLTFLVLSGRNTTERICPIAGLWPGSPKRDTQERIEYRQEAASRNEAVPARRMRCFPVSRRQNSRTRLSAWPKNPRFPLIVPHFLCPYSPAR